MRDGHLVQRLEGVIELIRAHFEAPGVGGNGGDLGSVQPAGRGERQAGSGAAGVVPPALAQRPRVLAGAYQHQVAAADRDAVRRGGGGQVLGRDREAVGQLAATASGGAVRGSDHPPYVEQHSAPAHRPGQLLDAGHQVAVGGDGPRRVPAVPRLAVVEDVPEPVPLRRALQRHGDHVVGAANAVREPLVAEGRVGPGAQHGVYRVGPPPPAALRPVHVETLGQREAGSATHQAGGGQAQPVGDEVSRAEHVVGAPPAPVGVRPHRPGDLRFRVRPVKELRRRGRRARLT